VTTPRLPYDVGDHRDWLSVTLGLERQRVARVTYSSALQFELQIPNHLALVAGKIVTCGDRAGTTIVISSLPRCP